MDPLSRAATLLILNSREEDAEGLIRSLRNGGLAVRGIFTSESERMEELISANTFELILCCEYDPAIDLGTCMMRYQELDTDVPLIIIADGATESSVLIEAMRSGARDLTEHGDADHLQLVVARELTDLHHLRSEDRLRERLAECEQRSRDLLDASGEAIALVQEGIHMQFNATYQALYGFEATEELEGSPLLDLIAIDYQKPVRESLRALEQHGAKETADIDVQCTGADGEVFDARLSVSRSRLDGEPCVRIIAEKQPPLTAQSLRSNLDPDTGLPNRAAFLEELGSRLAETGSARKPFAIIYIGISVFPELLRQRGLTGGLQTAAAIGSALHDLVPKQAYLARIGDDGYVFLVPDLEQAEAAALASRIGRQIDQALEGESVAEETPRCGTGLALAGTITRSATELLDTVYRDYLFSTLEPLPGPGPSELSETADENTDTAAQEEERKLSAHIGHALEVDGFQLVYQPIISLKGDSQESYSVLLRLRENDQSLLEAKDFLAAASRSGQIVAIDRWVIRNAVAEVAARRASGEKANFFVNVAEETLQEEKLLIWICDCLRELQARGNWLTLQVQEDHARRHTAVFARLSEGLRKVKCRVALSRFGEGPNPDLLLRSLHPDYARFPPDLGQGLAEDSAKQQRLKELTKMTREAGVKTVVTGVEDPRSLTLLWTADVDYVQGNFLQKPSIRIR